MCVFVCVSCMHTCMYVCICVHLRTNVCMHVSAIFPHVRCVFLCVGSALARVCYVANSLLSVPLFSAHPPSHHHALPSGGTCTLTFTPPSVSQHSVHSSPSNADPPGTVPVVQDVGSCSGSSPCVACPPGHVQSVGVDLDSLVVVLTIPIILVGPPTPWDSGGPSSFVSAAVDAIPPTQACPGTPYPWSCR
mgnify:CR=1 FL=1